MSQEICYLSTRMPIYRTPEERASETVTIRLTLHEKALLDYLAEIEGKTLTDLIRALLARRAEALQVNDIPKAPRQRRPGRPRTRSPKKPPADMESKGSEVVSAAPKEAAVSTAPLADAQSAPPAHAAHKKALLASNPVRRVLAEAEEKDGRALTFFDLLARFYKTFSHRAEGTKRELEETIEFLCLGGDEAIIPPDTQLAAFDSDRLREIRRIIQTSNIRFAKKNLHLTYLRMMLHFGVKDPDVDLHVNPTGELEPFSITESNEDWRFFGGR